MKTNLSIGDCGDFPVRSISWVENKACPEHCLSGHTITCPRKCFVTLWVIVQNPQSGHETTVLASIGGNPEGEPILDFLTLGTYTNKITDTAKRIETPVQTKLEGFNLKAVVDRLSDLNQTLEFDREGDPHHKKWAIRQLEALSGWLLKEENIDVARGEMDSAFDS
ncbi:hypothetical protein BU24DRAFT_461962 [Aaosphaeria arxii CBS 175.79]|uniref:Uncharacterized protein n=1 Tax=Aaosphaeria arxii CBS 175.79 TaxID=1450172 RepID=A0A6A5XSR5_9PLEO|nr:uncharacterized protein BU24DRAFT_461962 [Aaosphaeria arxii CBS 175.79]KAF2015730.1 hypothetical protein BU24DRAFT_461962 [Aaosphaeria arxii CBS 175.79]